MVIVVQLLCLQPLLTSLELRAESAVGCQYDVVHFKFIPTGFLALAVHQKGAESVAGLDFGTNLLVPLPDKSNRTNDQSSLS